MMEYPKFQVSHMDGGDQVVARAETADELLYNITAAMETLKQFRQKYNMVQNTIPEYNCPTCEGEMHFKSGTSKSGRAWWGYFCNNRECKGVRWAKADKTLK